MKVLGDRILVQAIDQQTHTTASGIITVEDDAPEVMGTVVQCPDDGDVRTDDVVLFAPSAGQVVEYDGARYIVLHADDILAVYE